MYNKMKNEEEFSGNVELPVNNHERYPPIALPPPSEQIKPMAPTTAQSPDNSQWTPIIIETGQRIMINDTSGVVVKVDDIPNPESILFNDEIIRKGFIRKVYFIVMTQLLITCGIVSVFVYHEPTKIFVQQNPVIVVMAIIANLTVFISMACCESARRKFPINFVCLGLFTFTMSVLLGSFSSRYEHDVILIAVGLTTLLVFALSIFAIQTKYDFTTCGAVLICCLMCVIIFGCTAIWLQDRAMYIGFASLGALLACFFIIYDTQLIVGGTHKYQISPEEYVFAALTLYVDIVRLFIYIVRIVGRR